MICPRCRGNGYIKVMDSIENPTETIHQCPQCDSQGEIMIDEQRMKSVLQKERDLLSVEHIRKLQEEIDMLRKQKIYLQSQLRKKESNDQRG
jgi:RecJ-like exonuclease